MKHCCMFLSLVTLWPMLSGAADEECGRALSFYRNGEIQWHKSADAVIEMPGAFVIDEGRMQGLVAMPLGALLGDDAKASMVEVLSCSGEAIRLEASQINAGATRYLFSVNRKGYIKLTHFETAGKPITALRYVTQVEVSN